VKPDSPALSPRQVWVLMFQQLPADPADPGNHAAEMAENPGVSVSSEYSAFDDLDKSSTFFEQYVIQDVRNSATAHEVLGGTDSITLFRQQLRTAGASVVHLRLVLTDNSANHVSPDATHSDPPQQSLVFAQESGVFFTEHHIQGTDKTAETGSVDPAVRDAMNSADLIWVDAWIQTESAEFRRRAAALAVQWIQQMRSPGQTEERPHDVLLVSSLRGPGRTIAAPFTSTGDEGLVHAPLWIDYGASHSCRLQCLAGSFDFLPTVLEYVTGLAPAKQLSTTADKDQASSRVLTDLDGNSVSLVTAVQSFCPGSDRLLRLTGDSWVGLRSQQYLLVRMTQSDNRQIVESEIDPEPAEASLRHLYLKPDDVWNVQDMIVAYEAIADEMEAIAGSVAGDSRTSG